MGKDKAYAAGCMLSPLRGLRAVTSKRTSEAYSRFFVSLARALGWCGVSNRRVRSLVRIAVVLLFALPSGSAYCAEGDGSRNGPKELLTINADAGFITFSPDGKRLAGKVSGQGWRATDVKMWEVATGKEVLVLRGHTGGIWNMSFSPNGKRLASNDNYTVKVWDLETRKDIRSFGTPAFTRSIVFTSGGKRVATGHDDGHVRLWDVETSRLARTLKGHTDWVPGLALSPDGKWLASGSVDRTAKIWDLTTGKEVLSLRGHEWYLNGVAFGPNGRRLISGSDDTTAKIWDLETGRELFTLRGHKDWVRHVAFSPDAKWVATASDDHTAKVWDTSTGKEVIAISKHTGEVSCVAFSPDGLRLATASHDKTIRLWDVTSFAREK